MENLQDWMLALKNPDWEIRKMATWSLGEIGDKNAVAPLTRALKDENPLVRIGAAEALGKLDDPKAVPDLFLALMEENQRVRAEALRSLKKLAPHSINHLIFALKSEIWLIRKTAAWALGELKNQSALIPLEQILLAQEEYPEVKAVTRKALQKILQEMENQQEMLIN